MAHEIVTLSIDCSRYLDAIKEELGHFLGGHGD
jgi:hypothetical protein